MKKIDEKLLIKTAEELNELFFDPGDTDIINVVLEPDELRAKIKEAVEVCLKPEDDLSKETIQVLKDLETDKETTDPPKGNDDLFAEVDKAERLRDLKDIAKSNDEFKDIRGKLSSYNTPKDLRTAMLDVLDELEKPEKTQEKKAEPEPTYVKNDKKKTEPKTEPKEKVKAEVKKPVEKKAKVEKSKDEKFTRTMAIATILKANPKLDEKTGVQKADALYMKRTGLVSNLTETRCHYRRVRQMMKVFGVE